MPSEEMLGFVAGLLPGVLEATLGVLGNAGAMDDVSFSSFGVPSSSFVISRVVFVVSSQMGKELTMISESGCCEGAAGVYGDGRDTFLQGVVCDSEGCI